MFIHTSVVQIGSFVVINLWQHVFALYQPQVSLARHGYRAHTHLSSLHGHLDHTHTHTRHTHGHYLNHLSDTGRQQKSKLETVHVRKGKIQINMIFNIISNECTVSTVHRATNSHIYEKYTWMKNPPCM